MGLMRPRNAVLRIVATALATAVMVSLLVACGSAESRKQRYYDRGVRYFSAHQYDKASLEFRNALQIDPHFTQARLELARTAERLGDPRAALGQYQAVVDAEPGNVQARVLEGRLFIIGRYSGRALDLVAPALATHPHDPGLLTVRGGAREQLGDAAGALADASEAYKGAPDDDYVVALLASVLKQSGKADQAISILRDALRKAPDSVDLSGVLADLLEARGDYSGAETQLMHLVQLEPHVLTHRYDLAHFYLRRNNVDAAEQTLRAAVVAEPTNDEPKLALIEFQRVQRGEGVADATLASFAANRPDDYALQLQMIGSLRRSLHQDKAEALSRDVIARAGDKPEGLTARDLLAAMLFEEGKTADAAQLIDYVLKSNARDGRALVLRATVELDRGDTAAAVTDLRTELRGDPNSVIALRMLARAYAKQGDLALAEDSLRTALQSSPKDVALRLDLTELLEQSGKTDQAEAMATALVADAPRNVQALELLFRLEAARKDYAAARATAGAVRSALPNQGMGAYLLGTIDEAEGKNDAAIQDYQNALALQPDSIEPLTALVDFDMAHRQFQQAMDRLDWVIAKAPRDYVAYNLKGQLFTAQGKYAEATAAFQTAMSIKPEWWVPYQNLARAQTKARDVRGSIETLTKGVDQTHYDLTLAGELAGLYELLGKPDEAIGIYERVISHGSNSAAATSSLALLLASYRSDPQSLSRAKSLASSLESSHNPAFEDTVGWVRFKTGDYPRALTALEEAARAAPTSPLVRYHLGMAQLRTGDVEDGRLNIRRALDSRRPFLGVTDAKATLASLGHAG
jgi:tetratricopeptide (TPR) repeat protein